MPDINITVTIPEAKVPLVRSALDEFHPFLPGETELQRAKRFLVQSIVGLVQGYQRKQARETIPRDEGVAT